MDLNTALLLLVALLNAIPAAFAAFFSWKAHVAALQAQTKIDAVALVTAARLEAAHTDIKTIEMATNSMKDALVKATGEAAMAEGRAIGRAEEQLRVANLAEGRLTAQEKSEP